MLSSYPIYNKKRRQVERVHVVYLIQKKKLIQERQTKYLHLVKAITRFDTL
jgi:hypothetical protein